MKFESLTLENIIPWWLTGPIFDKELRVCSRRKRYYWLRTFYLTLMALLIIIAWISSNLSFGLQGNAYSASRMAGIGRAVIISIVWFQFFISQIAAVLFFSGSICEEMNRGTLNVLLATPITSLQIVMGKLLSRLLLLVLILSLSLSTLAIVYAFGGIHWHYIISTFFITITSVIFIGTLTLLFSGMVKRPYYVIILMLTFICVYYIIGSSIYRAISGNTGQWILMLNPLTAMIEVTSPKITGPTGQGGGFAWGAHCMAMIAFSVLLVMFTIVRLRKTMLSFAFEKNIKAKGAIRRMKKLLTGTSSDYPIRLEGLPRTGKASLLRRIAVCALLIAWAVLCGFVLLAGNTAGSFSVFQILLNTLTTLVWLIVFIRTMIFASTAITKEKENRTLTGLLSTPLENSRIINGKFRNICRHNIIGWILVLINTIITSGTMMFRNPSVGMSFWEAIFMPLFSLLSIISSILFIVCFGLYISVRVKSNTVALVAVLVGYLLSYFFSYIILLVPMMLGSMIFSFGMFPVMIFGRPLINVGIGLLFFWRAKKTLRYYASVK